MSHIFSVDLEDWFHILDSEKVPKLEEWKNMETRVIKNTEKILDLLDKYETKATFFVLGWIAENYPDLIKEVARRGHELACHGHTHALIYEQTPEEFRADLRKAAEAIEAASGQRPVGYRAPGFSLTKDCLWALDIIREEGFIYDSSIFPASRGHGGIPGAQALPWVLPNGLQEFPISTVKLGGSRFSYIGGGYLRFLPLWMIKNFANRQVRQSEPLILYLHPRDLDSDQPRFELGVKRNFKTYVGLKTCQSKVENLLQSYKWGRFIDLVAPDQSVESA